MDRVLSNLDGLVTYLGGLREARKVIVLLTRGWTLPEDKTELANTTARNPGLPTPGVDPRGRITMDPNSGRGQSGDKTWCSTEQYRLLSMDFQQRLRDLIQASNRNNVTFYPINPAGLETPDIFSAETRGVPSVAAVMGSMNAMRDREDSMRDARRQHRRLRDREHERSQRSASGGSPTTSRRTTCSATTRRTRSSTASSAASK